MSQFSLVVAIACSFLVSNVCSQLQEQSEGSAPPPSFLRGAPQELINEFHKLLRESNSKTDKQIDEAIDAWINGQTPEIKKKYAEFKEDMKKQLHKAEEAHQAALAKFSPEAKEADAKLTAITTDPNLTAQEKHQKIGKLMNELPAKVRDEIIKAMKGGGN